MDGGSDYLAAGHVRRRLRGRENTAGRGIVKVNCEQAVALNRWSARRVTIEVEGRLQLDARRHVRTFRGSPQRQQQNDSNKECDRLLQLPILATALDRRRAANDAAEVLNHVKVCGTRDESQ